MVVNVTQEDIDNGKPRHICGCPVALAVKRMALDPGSVYVSGRYTNIDGHQHVNSRKTSKFVNDFDSGNPVKPFEFEIEFEVDSA